MAKYTQLSTLKNRLNLTDSTHDSLLETIIEAVSGRFISECDRSFGYVNAEFYEFSAADTEIVLFTYPIESVSGFQLKTNEQEGWIDQFPEFLIRNATVISLKAPLGNAHQAARVIHKGGYVLPGNTPEPGQILLPAELEHAAMEQAAAWFSLRDKVGLVRQWPSGGVFMVMDTHPLLPAVEAVLARYRRLSL